MLQPGLVVDLLLLIVGAPVVDAVVGLGGGGGVAGGVALLAPERHLGRGETHLKNEKTKTKLTSSSQIFDFFKVYTGITGIFIFLGGNYKFCTNYFSFLGE